MPELSRNVSCDTTGPRFGTRREPSANNSIAAISISPLSRMGAPRQSLSLLYGVPIHLEPAHSGRTWIDFPARGAGLPDPRPQCEYAKLTAWRATKGPPLSGKPMRTCQLRGARSTQTSHPRFGRGSGVVGSRIRPLSTSSPEMPYSSSQQAKPPRSESRRSRSVTARTAGSLVPVRLLRWHDGRPPVSCSTGPSPFAWHAGADSGRRTLRRQGASFRGATAERIPCHAVINATAHGASYLPGGMVRLSWAGLRAHFQPGKSFACLIQLWICCPCAPSSVVSLTYRLRSVVPSGGGGSKSAPPKKTTLTETS